MTQPVFALLVIITTDNICIYFSHKRRCYTGISGPEKAVTTQVKKYRIFSRAGNRVCTIGEIDPALFLI